MNGIIGRKLGMTRVYHEDGTVAPVTVIEAGPCPVVQVRDVAGRTEVQLGFESTNDKHSTRAARGHAARAQLAAAPRVLRAFSHEGDGTPLLGESVTVAIFVPGDKVKVTGTTKGRGFQGVVKRYGFRGGPASHGNTRHRKPGSIGPGTNPSRVLKGKRMPGHYGAARHTETGLTVIKIDVEQNLLYVRGAVPGPMRGLVTVQKQGGRGRYA